MTRILAITGSITGAEALWVDFNTRTLLFTDVSDFGLYIREMPSTDLASTLEILLNKLADRSQEEDFSIFNGLSCICVSTSGLDIKSNKNIIIHALSQVGVPRLSLNNVLLSSIAESTYSGISGRSPGVVLRSGMGCSLYAIDKNLKSKTVSALSSSLGSMGCELAISLQTLRQLCAFGEGNQTRKMEVYCREILDRLPRFDSVSAYFEYIHEMKRDRSTCKSLTKLKELSEIVFDLYDQGNPIAVESVQHVKKYIESVLKNVSNSLDLKNEEFQFIFNGSLFKKSRQFNADLIAMIKKLFPNCRFDKETGNARIIGAAKTATDEIDKTFSPQLIELVAASHRKSEGKLSWVSDYLRP